MRAGYQENLNLLNDAANLQTQVRQFEALRETRELLLKLRPNMRKNWLSLAVAYHLCGDLVGAKNVMQGYMNVVKVSDVLLLPQTDAPSL